MNQNIAVQGLIFFEMEVQKMNFTNDELWLIYIYEAETRRGTIGELKQMRKDLEDDETELLNLTDSVLKKIRHMTDKEYLAIDFTQIFIEMGDVNADET